MKEYTAKTENEAVALALEDLNVSEDDLTYEVIEEKKKLFSKKVTISCYTTAMVEEYISDFVKKVLEDMEFEVETVTYIQDERIYCNINSDNNSILIGKGGVILRAINLIVKNAVNNTFKKRIEVSVDINGYKESRYAKVKKMALRLGKTVQRTKTPIKLDPMPADERKVMHQAISEMKHLKTESKGEGRNRYITISYVD